MASWPATLPSPTAEGYGIRPVERVARSAIGAGKSQARSRFASAPARIPVRFVFSEAELAVFEAWLRHTVYDGGAWFSIGLANGQGVGSVSALFADEPRTDAHPAGGYVVTATLFARSLPQAA
jgi:hypothetical protein